MSTFLKNLKSLGKMLKPEVNVQKVADVKIDINTSSGSGNSNISVQSSSVSKKTDKPSDPSTATEEKNEDPKQPISSAILEEENEKGEVVFSVNSESAEYNQLMESVIGDFRKMKVGQSKAQNSVDDSVEVESAIKLMTLEEKKEFLLNSAYVLGKASSVAAPEDLCEMIFKVVCQVDVHADVLNTFFVYPIVSHCFDDLKFKFEQSGNIATKTVVLLYFFNLIYLFREQKLHKELILNMEPYPWTKEKKDDRKECKRLSKEYCKILLHAYTLAYVDDKTNNFKDDLDTESDLHIRHIYETRFENYVTIKKYDDKAYLDAKREFFDCMNQLCLVNHADTALVHWIEQ